MMCESIRRNGWELHSIVMAKRVKDIVDDDSSKMQ